MTSDKKKVNYQSGEDKLTNTKYSKLISCMVDSKENYY